ncbi:uroporphyrinogen-III C-methyltransferase [Pectinatus cerevisiiphilus]|uniref:uroporphyrinogen-III C-methyltransferase n=1 Tax=Pectinatus cerevisiiphilus TaxID=86956 RepID=A0A4R3KFY3_9FIRM|nr:uroporphyrinogen-III C-methyltransferase [Pectinatus cerevisiiphilus]TCS81993.1 uroporphyrinogen III methyltransferase/synthase [Pectinatus cerevisiiphilus]
MAGIVYLIGAGPGDAGLLTIKGAACIKKADVIVYDYLADKKLLAYAADKAELIYVGKQADKHTMRQEEINQLLVDKAKMGKTVARLKGGDPFVFGRGGEEALALRQNGLQFEIVPGVTSAISAAAYAGIPVTHRKIAASFAVVTGHEDPTRQESGINWQNLAVGIDTLVFLMGVGNLPYITKQLIANGREPKTPAALVRWGTKPQQEVLVTTVENAAADVKKYGLKPPAVFVVGNVVKLRDSLRWFDNKELFGRQILITRARNQASKLTAGLEQLGASCIEAPVISIEKPDDAFAGLDNAIENIGAYEWIIFTSANGVSKFFERLANKKLDTRALGNMRIAAIGSSTAKVLCRYGVRADLVPHEFCAEGILAEMGTQVKRETKILLPRAKEARSVLPDELKKAGAQVDIVQCYKTVTADFDYEAVAAKLAAGEINIVTFTSSSTVTNLLKLLGNKKELLAGTVVACIGPITAETCRKNGINPTIIAKKYTIVGLISAIRDFYKQVN